MAKITSNVQLHSKFRNSNLLHGTETHQIVVLTGYWDVEFGLLCIKQLCRMHIIDYCS